MNWSVQAGGLAATEARKSELSSANTMVKVNTAAAPTGKTRINNPVASRLPVILRHSARNSSSIGSLRLECFTVRHAQKVFFKRLALWVDFKDVNGLFHEQPNHVRNVVMRCLHNQRAVIISRYRPMSAQNAF